MPVDALASPIAGLRTLSLAPPVGWFETGARLLRAITRGIEDLSAGDHHREMLRRGEPVHAEVLLRLV